MTKKIKGYTIHRQAGFVPQTVNEEERTVEMTFTTGAIVKRRDWFGDEWEEELEVSERAMKLDRLKKGGPFLDSHDTWGGVRSVIGVVVSASIKDGQGVAKVKFSERAEVEPIFRDVKAGILRNISVGYKVHKWHQVTHKDDPVQRFRAVDWEPLEISLVAIPADPNAQVRSHTRSSEHDEFFMEIETRDLDEGSISPMEPKTKPEGARAQSDENPAPAQAAAPAPSVDAEAVRKEAAENATKAERARVAEITASCRKLGLGDDFAQELIEKGVKIEEARKAMIDKAADSSPTKNIQNQVRIEAGAQDEITARGEAVEMAILQRVEPAKHKLEGLAQDFRGMSLLEMGREFLRKSGVSTRGWDKARLVTELLSFRGGMHSTSDFPYILANVANKSLLSGYEALIQAQTFRPLCKVASLPDFKQASRTRLGEVPSLVALPEGAEITRGTIGESREVYNLATYAREFAITRHTLINDDLEAFTNLPSKFGAAASRIESDTVWALLTGNSTMGDGNSLFDDTNHGNYTSSGTVINVANLGVGKTKMRKQTGISGSDYLNVIPKFLLVPAAIETVALQYVSSAYNPDAPSNINPFAGALKVIVEPRLDADDANGWYLSADPKDGVDVIEIAYLDGMQGPQTQVKPEFGVGVVVAALLDFGAKVLDWRGLYFNAGA